MRVDTGRSNIRSQRDGRDRVINNERRNEMAAMPMPLIEVQSMGQDLAQRTVCVKVRLGRLGNTRKVSTSQVEVDTDKSLIRVSKHLIDSKELRTIANFDGEIRRYLYDTCLPFEAGLLLCPLALQ